MLHPDQHTRCFVQPGLLIRTPSQRRASSSFEDDGGGGEMRTKQGRSLGRRATTKFRHFFHELDSLDDIRSMIFSFDEKAPLQRTIDGRG